MAEPAAGANAESAVRPGSEVVQVCLGSGQEGLGSQPTASRPASVRNDLTVRHPRMASLTRLSNLEVPEPRDAQQERPDRDHPAHRERGLVRQLR